MSNGISHTKEKKFKYLISIFIYYIFEFKYFNCILLKKKKKKTSIKEKFTRRTFKVEDKGSNLDINHY